MKFSVIIAAHNEGPEIASGLKRLRQISQTSPMEVIVVDGGSDDVTVELAKDWADEVLRLDAPNRGAQWRAGAEKAGGDLLLFLRADSQPPGNWQQALEHFWLATPVGGVAAAAFRVDYGGTRGLRALSAWSNGRARRGIVDSDHGLCTTPDIYRAVGGHPDFPVLEDYELSRRLASRGRVAVLPEVVRASARRLRARGPLSYAMRRLWLETRYRLGAQPSALFEKTRGL